MSSTTVHTRARLAYTTSCVRHALSASRVVAELNRRYEWPFNSESKLKLIETPSVPLLGGLAWVRRQKEPLERLGEHVFFAIHSLVERLRSLTVRRCRARSVNPKCIAARRRGRHQEYRYDAKPRGQELSRAYWGIEVLVETVVDTRRGPELC